jgi:hypothetical protein
MNALIKEVVTDKENFDFYSLTPPGPDHLCLRKQKEKRDENA